MLCGQQKKSYKSTKFGEETTSSESYESSTENGKHESKNSVEEKPQKEKIDYKQIKGLSPLLFSICSYIFIVRSMDITYIYTSLKNIEYNLKTFPYKSLFWRKYSYELRLCQMHQIPYLLAAKNFNFLCLLCYIFHYMALFSSKIYHCILPLLTSLCLPFQSTTETLDRRDGNLLFLYAIVYSYQYNIGTFNLRNLKTPLISLGCFLVMCIISYFAIKFLAWLIVKHPIKTFLFMIFLQPLLTCMKKLYLDYETESKLMKNNDVTLATVARFFKYYLIENTKIYNITGDNTKRSQFKIRHCGFKEKIITFEFNSFFKYENLEFLVLWEAIFSKYSPFIVIIVVNLLFAFLMASVFISRCYKLEKSPYSGRILLRYFLGLIFISSFLSEKIKELIMTFFTLKADDAFMKIPIITTELEEALCEELLINAKPMIFRSKFFSYLNLNFSTMERINRIQKSRKN